ncbi:MAG: hypothetical protein ACD_16C00221G0005 [uncultured bacterium]|nr:MAG: hypothetical protein ACD_16C00221G0005 [uncultured bacterium]OFW84453.1 MAG: hypothetical protein A3E50_07390 [Alphaproteobacteria bacterium RIFCSPHIGHO2_12_FULL_42_100]OFW86389.1 MAG: hypothetical protein A2W06_02160 [Alphaproteobacteria bacterium RBG_16_42_14]OFX00261.1 MAG: hypothetical protein A2W62_05155 [Alphaproteobacteria bacterium RIFCSPLOWO2_02_42_7]HBG34813.1 hypothetical protein [Holosporales bacterium]
MSKWLNRFLENEIVNRSDKSDRFRFETNMSPLSLRPRGLLDEKMEKVENNHSKGGDKSARFRFEANMSPLSLHPQGFLDEKMKKMENNPNNGGDKSDRFRFETNMSGSSLRENFEERLAIAEYDGKQTPLQAQRIAYLDAFMAVLSTLPYEEEGYYDEDWLTRRIKATQHWLEAQGLQQPK